MPDTWVVSSSSLRIQDRVFCEKNIEKTTGKTMENMQTWENIEKSAEREKVFPEDLVQMFIFDYLVSQVSRWRR